MEDSDASVRDRTRYPVYMPFYENNRDQNDTDK